MRMIDADALIAELHNTIFEDGEDRANVYRVIQGRPTISAQPDVPDTNVGDMINRQAAIDALACLDDYEEEAIEALRKLPSEQPTQKNDSNTLNALDCVSRQAAIEAIHEDADWLAAQGSDWQVERMERDKSILMSLPSAQAEIIRCRDCKNWDKTWTNDWSPEYHYCPMIDGVRKGDFYCAHAERRTDE